MVDYELISKCIDDKLTNKEILEIKNKISNDIEFAREYREIKKISSIIQNNMRAIKREYILDLADEIIKNNKKNATYFQTKRHFPSDKLQSLLQPVFEHFEELLLRVQRFLR